MVPPVHGGQMRLIGGDPCAQLVFSGQEQLVEGVEQGIRVGERAGHDDLLTTARAAKAW